MFKKNALLYNSAEQLGNIVVKTIFITRGLVTVVDDADFDMLNAFSWMATPASNKKKHYVSRSIWVGGSNKTVYMHRVLLNAPRGLEVDHIDGDSLNNQRANLRLCTKGQNAVNRRSYSPASGYRGVYGNTPRDTFKAEVTTNGERQRLGTFADPVEAAKAYDKAAMAAFGDFAILNFPERA